MPISNSAVRYGSVTKTFHWLTALLIIGLIPLGWYANQLPYDTSEQLACKAWLFSLHKTFGVTVFFVALARIVWALTQAKPRLLNADHKVESFVAELVHWLLYAALVIVPLSGWITHAASQGFAPIWWPFGQSLPLIPKSTGVEHAFGGLHWVATKLLALAVLLHIAGALKHHIVDRDPTLMRMLPGGAAVGPLPPQDRSLAPALAALALWMATIVLGIGLGMRHDDTTVPAEQLADVASQWQVQEGSIGLTITQFGLEVSGSFADWTAAIRFDETVATGLAGDVDVTISIPSLSLGSVTAQALGPDFFDATIYPDATYAGPIMRVADGYEVDGVLTIRDVSVPVILPFSLTLDGGSAEILSRFMLNRRDFNIGDTMTDEAMLAFTVKILIELTAERAAE